MTHELDIPDFLKATPENTAAARKAWKAKKLGKKKAIKRRPFHLPKTMEPAGLALLKQIEADKAAKREARFAMLKSRNRR